MITAQCDMPRSRGGWLWSVRRDGRLVSGWLNQREATDLCARLRAADCAAVYQHRPYPETQP